jgi:hypothetical protein
MLRVEVCVFGKGREHVRHVAALVVQLASEERLGYGCQQQQRQTRA